MFQKYTCRIPDASFIQPIKYSDYRQVNQNKETRRKDRKERERKASYNRIDNKTQQPKANRKKSGKELREEGTARYVPSK